MASSWGTSTSTLQRSRSHRSVQLDAIPKARDAHPRRAAVEEGQQGWPNRPGRAGTMLGVDGDDQPCGIRDHQPRTTRRWHRADPSGLMVLGTRIYFRRLVRFAPLRQSAVHSTGALIPWNRLGKQEGRCGQGPHAARRETAAGEADRGRRSADPARVPGDHHLQGDESNPWSQFVYRETSWHARYLEARRVVNRPPPAAA